MPEWPQIISEHGELVWKTVNRLVPTGDPAARVTETFLDAQGAAHRDSVSNWPTLLQHIAIRRSLNYLREQVKLPRTTLAESLRLALVGHPEQRALAFGMRYFCKFSYAEIAMELRAPLDTIGPMVSETCTVLGHQLLIYRGSTPQPAQDSTQAADDLLERAVVEIRNAEVPPMPAGLLEEITEAVRANPETPFEKPPEPSRKVPITIAAAIAVIIATVVLAKLYTREAPPAFGFDAVLAAIGEKPSVQYHLVRTMQFPDSRTRKLDAEILSRDPGHVRQTMSQPRETIIWDYPAGKAMTLDATSKRATLRDAADMLDELRPVDALPLLKKLQPAMGEATVQRSINGRTTQGFAVKTETAAMKLWADLDSKLPVLVEIQFSAPETPGDALLTDFDWTPPDNLQLVSLEPPPGYELSAFRVNLKAATEIDLLRALDIAARYNGGKFPPRFDRVAMASLIRKQQEQLPADKKSAEYQVASDRLDAELLQLGRGFLFVAENGEDWRYAGADVFLSSRDPVLWYRPSGSNMYRLINGSLDVRAVPEDRLPTTQAVPMVKPTERPQRLGNP